MASLRSLCELPGTTVPGMSQEALKVWCSEVLEVSLTSKRDVLSSSSLWSGNTLDLALGPVCPFSSPWLSPESLGDPATQTHPYPPPR